MTIGSSLGGGVKQCQLKKIHTPNSTLHSLLSALLFPYKKPPSPWGRRMKTRYHFRFGGDTNLRPRLRCNRRAGDGLIGEIIPVQLRAQGGNSSAVRRFLSPPEALFGRSIGGLLGSRQSLSGIINERKGNCQARTWQRCRCAAVFCGGGLKRDGKYGKISSK